MMARHFFLIDPNKKRLRIESAFKFGRLTDGYRSITAYISKTHFVVEPLSIDDDRSDEGANCGILTLKGRYLRINGKKE